MKYKTYFEVIFISLAEVKFNNDSAQFEFGAKCCTLYRLWNSEVRGHNKYGSTPPPPHSRDCFTYQRVLYL